MQASSKQCNESSAIDLMQEMAQPKPLELRLTQLVRLQHNLPYGSLLACTFWLLAGLVLQPYTDSFSLASLVLAGLLITGTISLFARQMVPRMNPASRFLPRNIAFLSLMFSVLAAAFAFMGGILAGTVTAGSPLNAYEILIPLFFGTGTLLAILLGAWLTPFLLLLSMPLWWTATWLLNSPVEVIQPLLNQTIAILVLNYLIAAIWHIYSHTTLIRHLQLQKLVEYLNHSRDSSEQANQQLVKEINEHEQMERQLRLTMQEQENTLCEKRRELADLEMALAQQGKLRRSISHALVKSQGRLAQAIEAAELALWDWDLENDAVYQSFFHKAFGAQEMTGKDYLRQLEKVVPEQHLQHMRATMKACLQGNTPTYKAQYPVQPVDAPVIWVEDCGKPVAFHPQTGRVTRMLGTRRSITVERQKSQQLVLAKSVFDNTNEGIFVLDETLRFLTVNRAFTQITGYSSEDVLGQKITDISATPQKTRVFECIQDALMTEGSWQGELCEKRKQGDYFIKSLQLKAITNASGHITHYTGLFTDMTEKKIADEKLHYLLHYDELTGLANRVLFRDRLHTLLSAMRDSPAGLALILIDIDRFRQVNESLGHDRGDELLKQTALRIARVSQESDTVARLGNDEFAVLLPGSRMDEARPYCEQLLEELQAPFMIAGQELFISSSLGITMAPQHGKEIHALMQQVNVAVKQAKYLGGNRLEFYSKSLQSLTGKRLDVETELRRGLQKNQLEVYYQPQYSLRKKCITGAEALVRWAHPERGLITPMEFVPIAEESGLIAAIGEFVLRKACQQSAEWSKAGLGNIRVSVNVSAYQLRQNNLIEQVDKVLEETGLDPAMLDLELTESALMENLARTNYTLNRLRQMGIQITIDDFGTGYSSLAYLKRFPINALKVDRVFVKDSHLTKGDASIIQAIILLGKSLGMEVIAEGVETPEQLAFLQEQSCDLVQGYLISHPVKASLLARLLENQNCNAITEH
jgi:diguanylate cyclase (GGDEF)-like protein/PAS domain S-box-containing protein